MSSSGKHHLSPSRTIITSFTPRKFHNNNHHNHNHHHQYSTVSNTASAAAAASLYEEGDWVLCLTSSEHRANPTSMENGGVLASESFSCALSNGQIQVYDAQRLHFVRSFQHASPSVTQLMYGRPPQQHSHLLFSAGREGVVNLYDLRSSSSSSSTTTTTTTTTAASSQIQLPSQQPALCLDLGYDGYLAAIGSCKGRIHFVDWRNPTQILGTYSHSHRDDITQVQFCNYNNNHNNQWLLSGSDDGLVCLFDTSQPTEETALSTLWNVGAPVRKAGLMSIGTSAMGFQKKLILFCVTGHETLGLWDVETSGPIETFRREHFWSLTQPQPQQPQQSTFMRPLWNSLEYLVDAHWNGRELLVLAGGTTTSSPVSSIACNSALFRLRASADTSTTDAVSLLPHIIHPQHHPQHPLTTNAGSYQFGLEHVESMVGGHCGVIRAWCPLTANTILTAGEDARLCEWQTTMMRGEMDNTTLSSSLFAIPSTTTTTTATTTTVGGTKRGGSPSRTANGGGPWRRPRQRFKSSTSPY